MSIVLFDSGTQTATLTTEHFVSSPDEAGVFTFHVDLSDMESGDGVEIVS